MGSNAGIFPATPSVIRGNPDEWRLVYDINVLGCWHVLRTFAPQLIAQKEPSAIEVTASMAGVSRGGAGAYGTSKLAVLGIAEALSAELRTAGAAGKVHVVSLCPGVVVTSLLESSSEVQGAADAGQIAQDAGDEHAIVAGLRARMGAVGMSSDFVGEEVFSHLADGRFYCLLNGDASEHASIDQILTTRFESMMSRVPIEMPSASEMLEREATAAANARL